MAAECKLEATFKVNFPASTEQRTPFRFRTGENYRCCVVQVSLRALEV